MFDFVKHLQELDSAHGVDESESSKTATATAPEKTQTGKSEETVQEPKTEKQASYEEFVASVNTRTEKIAKVIEDERGDEHAQLFRNCVSSCFHYKMAGYTLTVKEDVDDEGNVTKTAVDHAEDPAEFMAMCYNMYKDILGEGNEDS